MDVVKEIQKKAEEVMKDDKKKEQLGDAVEGALKEAKKNIKNDNTKKTIDTIIKSVDGATSSKQKKNK